MRLLVLSDIHANYPALQAVLDAAGSYDALVFLGDVVDYGPHPLECLRFIAANTDYCVRGNHDHALGYDTDCGCRGDFRKFSVETRKWHRTLLNESERVFLQRMPIVSECVFDGSRFFLAHASPQGDLTRYLEPSELPEVVQGIDADFILLGHTHVPVKLTDGKTTIVNPGNVGLPRDFGQAAYAIFENGKVTLHRVCYDVDQTIADLERSAVPGTAKRGLARILKSQL